MINIAEIDLIQETNSKDELLQEFNVQKKKTIIAKIKSVSYKEFYEAKNLGFNPTYIFEIYPFEYEHENKLIYNDEEYKVIRTFSNSSGKLELTCELKGK